MVPDTPHTPATLIPGEVSIDCTSPGCLQVHYRRHHDGATVVVHAHLDHDDHLTMALEAAEKAINARMSDDTGPIGLDTGAELHRILGGYKCPDHDRVIREASGGRTIHASELTRTEMEKAIQIAGS